MKNVGMCYVKYDQDIVTKHKVELVGWPVSIKFANPSEIGTVDDIRKLRQALKVGDCKWIVQSRGQQAAYAERLAEKVAAGEQVVKKRKERSDKGKPRVSKKAASGQSGKGGRKHIEDKERGPGVGEDDSNSNSNDSEESRQLPKKKRKYTAAKGRIEKKLPPTQKSNEFINTDDEDDDDDE
jgi:hypothetical protein